MQEELTDAKHQLGTLSLQSKMRNAFRKGSTHEQTQDLQKDIEVFSERTPLFSEILVANTNGEVIVGNLPSFIGTSLKGTWEFEAPLLGINFDSRVVKSHRLGKYISTQSAPIYDIHRTGSPLGVVIGSIDWGTLQKDLSRHTVFGAPQSSQRQVILESTENQSILYATDIGNVPYHLLGNEVESTPLRSVTLAGKEFLMVTIDSKPMGGYRDPQWRLHILLDNDIAYATARTLKNNFYFTAALMLFLAVLASLLFSRTIVRPVKSLLGGAEKLASGDYDYELPNTHGKDEIAQLTQSFNTMRESVKDNEHELKNKTEIAEQAAKLKGEFLANMSHEVRTPINGVLGMTELLMNTHLDETQCRYAKAISRSSQALLAVINDILDFSKIEAGKLDLSESAFDLRDLVEDTTEIVAEMAHKKGLDIHLQMSPDSPTAFNGDCSRLRQVLLNLMSNAVKFTSSGEIKVEVSFPNERHNKTKPAPGLRKIDFKVIDTGIGIEKKEQLKIFESFVQADGSNARKYGGTGLGLAISSHLVSMMGGKLGVISERNKGSTFFFSIELEQLPETVERLWRNKDSLKDKRILIVDDNLTNQEILFTQLKYWGAVTCVAGSGASAIKKIKEATNQGVPFDFGILDMHMPAMSGLELARQIHDQNLTPNTQLVILSSSSDILDFEICRKVGIRSIASKPLRQTDLYSCLTAVMPADGTEIKTQKQVARKIPSNALMGHVLLAEDNPVNQDIMIEVLSIMGVSTKLANNGKEAIESFEKERFDLILMDCQMPVLDGLAATSKIRQLEKQGNAEPIPIVALTANAMQGDREKCINAGMDEYLSKPVSSEQLRKMLSNWLKTARPDNEQGEITQITSDTSSDAVEDTTDVLNQTVFSEVWDMCEQAPAGFFQRLLTTYKTDSASDLKLLKEAIDNDDAETVGSRAHRLKSSTASWGAQNLTELLKSLEKSGKSNELKNAPLQLRQIEKEHAILIEVLQSYQIKAA